MKILGASRTVPGTSCKLFPVTHSKYFCSSVKYLLLPSILALFSLTIITNASQNHTLANQRQTTVRNQSGKQLNSTLGKQLHLHKGNQSKKPYTPATSSSYSKHGHLKYPDISQLERMVALASGSSITNASAPRTSSGQDISAEMQASLNSIRKQQQQQQAPVSNSSRLDLLEREVLPSSPFSSAIEPAELLASVRHEERPLGRTELIEQAADDYATQSAGYYASEQTHIPPHPSTGITRLNHHRYVPQEASYSEHVKHNQYAHQSTYDGHELPSITHHSLAGVARAPPHRYIPQEVLRHNQYSHPTGVSRAESTDDAALELAEFRLANHRVTHEGAFQSGEHPGSRGELASSSLLYPSHHNGAAEKRAAHIRVVFNNNPQFIIGRGAADGHVLGTELRKKHSAGSYGSNHDDYHSDESSLDETKVVANAPSKLSASETVEESALPCNKDKSSSSGKSKLIPNMEQISLSPSSELQVAPAPAPAPAPAEVDTLAKKPTNNSNNFEKVDDENGQVNVPFNEIIKSGIRPPLRMVISMRNKNGDVMKLPINLHGSSKARAPSLDLGSQMRIHFEPQTDPIPELEPPEQQQQQQHIDENTPIGGDIFDPSISRPFSTKSRVSARAREEPRPVPIITPQQSKDKPDQILATNLLSGNPGRVSQASTSFAENSPEPPVKPIHVEQLPSAPSPPAIAPKLTESLPKVVTAAHTEPLPVPQAQVRVDPASLPVSAQVSQQLPLPVSAKIKVETNEEKAKALNKPFVSGETPIPTPVPIPALTSIPTPAPHPNAAPVPAPALSSVPVKVEQPLGTQLKETNVIANVDQQEKRQRDCDRDDDDNNNNPQIIIPSIGMFQNRTLASIFEQFQRAFSEQMQQTLPQQQHSMQQPQQIPTLQLQDQLPQIHQVEQQFVPQQQFLEQQQQQQQQMFQQTRPELQRAASADNRNEANSNINNNNEEQQRRRQQQAFDQQEDLMVAMMASNISSPDPMTGGEPKQVSMTVIHPPKGTSIEDAIRVHATNAQDPSQTVAILHSARDSLPPSSAPQLVEQGELSVVDGNDNEARPFSVNVQLRPGGKANPNSQPNQGSPDQAQTDPDGFASSSRYSPRYLIGRSHQSSNIKLHPRFKRSTVVDGEYAERQLEPADRLSSLREKSRSSSFSTLLGPGTRLTSTNSTYPQWNDKEDIIMSAASDEHQNEVDSEGDSDSNGDEEPSESDMDSRSDNADLDDSPDGSDLDDSPDESAGFGDSDDEPYNQGASSERDYNSPASFEIPQIEINPNTLQQRGCKTVLREVQELPLNGLGASSASGASPTVSPNSPSTRRTKRSPNGNQNLINSRKVTSIVMTKECHFPNDSTGSPTTSSATQQPQTSNVANRAAHLIMDNNIAGLKGPPLSGSIPPTAQQLQKQQQQERAPIQRRSLADSPVQTQISGTQGGDRDFYVVSDSRRNEVISQKLYKPPSEDDPYHTLSYSSKNGADPEDPELDRQLVYNPDAPIPGEKRTQLEASPGRQLSPSERRALLDPNHDDTDPVRPEPTEAPEPAEEQDEGEPDDDDEKPRGGVVRGRSNTKRPPSGMMRARADSSQKGQQSLQGKRQQQASPERRFGKSFRLEHKLSRPADSQSGLGAQLRKLPAGRQGFVERRTGGSNKRRPANNQRDDQQAVLAAIEREDRDTADDDVDDDDDDEPAASSADGRMGGRGTGSGVNSIPGRNPNAQGASAPELDEPDADPDYNPREGRIPAHSKPKKVEKSFAYVHRDVPKKGTKNADDFVVSYGRGNVQTEHEDYDSDRDPRVQSEDLSEDKPAEASAQRLTRLVTPTAAPRWPALGSTTPSNLYQPAQAQAQAHYVFPAPGAEMELEARNLGQQGGPVQSNGNLPILMRFG